ncbi:hypothetical protein [Aquamicrobium zhengzhouense]|uniref:Uncharacterized protein n=1 Tax=Aquamicrobium zhengzhouense TaxID=2781738 RepID=A0ABS0SCD2_9HYPH|nr:hypothetical protein [Aquamicrobium zhengzhouense]MBI1620366.1 hypothetical protein [Aquamicrobium zhengzhouense]
MTPSEQIIEFNRVWKWLEKAVKRGGNTHEKQHVLARILDGRAQLWTNREAAIVTSIETYDNGFKEIQGWLAGGKLSAVQQLRDEAEAWGKQMGCSRSQLISRPGFERAFPGYRRVAVVLVKDL